MIYKEQYEHDMKNYEGQCLFCLPRLKAEGDNTSGV